MTTAPVSDPLRSALDQTARICSEYLKALRFVTADTRRDPEYLDNHLLSYLAQDFIESAHAIPLLVEQGIQNVARREARFILEAHLKMCFVQQQEYQSSIRTKLDAFESVFDSSKITIKRDILLNLLPEEDRPRLLEEAGRLYNAASSYVHLSCAQIFERIERVDAERTAGRESPADVERLNDLLSRVLACSLVFLFHSVPEYVAGDWLVEPDGSTVDWYFTRSRYLALIDARYDYKFERQERLKEIEAQRNERLTF